MVAGYDLASNAGGLRMKPGDETDIAGTRVAAFGSTDSGVSFLVNADGASIFHAGDFNFWHWREQSGEGEIAEAARDFKVILDTMRGKRVDIAFFPVDPRLGEGHDEGAMLYVEAVKPRYLIPMHWWGDAAAALAFSKKHMPHGVNALALTEPGLPVKIII
jgi:L-ascorbate metabolism protein UlaG (beta-lactamase superfamily)